MVILGLAFALMGISALVFNKYPAKDAQIMKLKEQFMCINEKDLCNFEGAYLLIIGSLISLGGLFPTNNIIMISIIIMIMLLAVSQNLLRNKFLGLR